MTSDIKWADLTEKEKEILQGMNDYTQNEVTWLVENGLLEYIQPKRKGIRGFFLLTESAVKVLAQAPQPQSRKD